MAINRKDGKEISILESSCLTGSERPKNVPLPAERTPYPKSLSLPRESLEYGVEGLWMKKTILTIHGGYKQSYSSLLILQALMSEVQRIEQTEGLPAPSSTYSAEQAHVGPGKGYRPCHYFDYIAGLSSGGIFAIMLGRNRMTIEEAMAEDSRLCALTFVGDSEALVQCLHTMPPVTFPAPDGLDDDSKRDPVSCRAIAYLTQPPSKGQVRDGLCYRSFNQCPARSEFMRLLTADFGSEGEQIPPVNANTKELLDDLDFKVIEEVESLSREMPGSWWATDSLISIGDALRAPLSLESQCNSELGAITARNSEHQSTASCRGKPLPIDYHRFDIDNGIEELKIATPLTRTSGKEIFKRIDAATKRYLQQDSIAAELRSIAASLVKKRRQRAGTVRWERWATGVEKMPYTCPMIECPTTIRSGGHRELFQKRADLLQHLRDSHGLFRGIEDGKYLNATLDIGWTGTCRSDQHGKFSAVTDPEERRVRALQRRELKFCGQYRINYHVGVLIDSE